jgi:hypothetical protein
MLKATLILSLLLAATPICMFYQSSSPKQEPEYSNQAGQAGPFVITNNDYLTGKNVHKDAEIRAFLWDHWRQRKPGKLVETRYSKEGVPATTTFILEPDTKGHWTIAVERRWPPRRGSTPEHDHTEYRVYSIRRIEPRNGGQSPAAFIADDAVRPGDRYWLVFYDEQGKETGGV